MNYKIAFLIAILYACSAQVKAQDVDTLPVSDTAAMNAVIAAVDPVDIDPAKIDSFYRLKSIDLQQAESIKLYYEIFKWYHTCYRWGGNTDHGIDCSHFVNMLFEKIYGRTLGPDVGTVLGQCKIIKKGISAAKEGDLVFFKIRKGQVSHVGIYLQNNKFAHASVHSGVVISDLDEAYYKKRFYKVGRVQ